MSQHKDTAAAYKTVFGYALALTMLNLILVALAIGPLPLLPILIKILLSTILIAVNGWAFLCIWAYADKLRNDAQSNS